MKKSKTSDGSRVTRHVSRIKTFKQLSGLTFGVGGNTVNSKFPSIRRVIKDDVAKKNIQTLGFNGAMVTK